MDEAKDTFKRRVSRLANYLSRAYKYDKPSILFAMYLSEFLRSDVEKSLKSALDEQGLEVVSVDAENIKDLPAFFSARNPENTVFSAHNMEKGFPDALRYLNFKREELIEHHVKAVFWVREEELARISLEAPDFFAFRNRVVEFMEAPTAEERSPALVEFTSETEYRALDELKRSIELKEKLLSEFSAEDEISGYLLYSLGDLYLQIGSYKKSLEYSEKALKVARDIGDRHNEGALLGNLGNAYYGLGQMERAIEYHEQALAIAKEIGDRQGEGTGFGNLGLAYADLGQVERAIEYYEQAIAITKEIGDRRNEGNRLGNLGLAYADLGQVGRAIEYYEQALAIAKEIGDRRNEGNRLGNLGIAYHLLGQVERAIEYYKQALAIAKEIRDKRGEGRDLGNFGNAYSSLGQVERAIEYYEQALAIAKEIGDRQGEGTGLGNLGLAYANLGQVGRAIEYYEQALAIAKEIGDRRGEGRDLGNLGLAYYAMGQVERAIEHYKQALAIAKVIGDRRNEGNWLRNLGIAYSDLGQVERATEYYTQALAISKDENSTEIIMDEKTQKATLKISDGRTRDLKVKTEDGKLNIYMMRDVFISYAREEEKDYAIPLAVALSDLNVTLWIDIKELLAGTNLRKDIDKGIEESQYGIALLSENYFSKEYTLLELETFKKKQKEIIPIRCGFIDPYLDDKKYSFLKESLRINWKEGIENVMEKIIRAIRPELLPESVYSDIRLKNIPTPQNQLHAASIIKTYRGAGRKIEASQIALDYLSLYPNDPNILNLYFNSARATNNKYIIEIAIIKISEYLKNNPNNIGVRENFISYLTKVKTGNIYQQIIIDDTCEWLENHHNVNIKKDYLDIVLKKGNHEQVKRAIKEGKKWLIEEDNIQIRCALFRLVRRRGSPIEIADMLKETVNWITSNMGNKDSKNLIVDYITYIKDNGNYNQRRNAIEICEEWSRKNPEDNFVLPAYLSLIFRLRDLQYIDRAFNFIQEWLSFPFKKQSTSINVREHYIKFIRLLGSQEQVEEVIKENRKWLKGIEKVESQQNVRAGLLNLINIRGTDAQVLEEINITLEWLNNNKNETYVRSNLLNLAEERCRENSIKDTIFENYTCWLNENRNYEPGTEVRKRFIRYILEVGSCLQQRKVIEDNEKWINVHNDKKVKKVLDELIRKYTEYC